MRLYRPLSLKLPLVRRKLMYRKNVARAPKGYTAKGVKVHMSFHGHPVDGVIENQVFGGIGAMFRVRFSKPISAASLGIGPESPLWQESHRLGCLQLPVSPGLQAKVTCGFARWRDLTIPVKSLKKGQPIELVDTHSSGHVMTGGRDHAVRFVKSFGFGKPIVVWFPEPMTYMDLEDLVDLNAIHPTHISKDSYYIPFKGYKALYRAGVRLPPAKRKKYAGTWIMEFKEPVPIKKMADYIRKSYETQKADEPDLPVKSVWYTLMQTILFHMAPIKYDSIDAIRPMREDLFYGLVVPAEVALEGL